MTTLKATPAQSIALERRRLTDRAALVRGRVEATPGCNLLPKMANVENRMRLMQFAMAKTLLDEIDDTLEDIRRKAEAEEMQRGHDEQDKLLAANGAETARTASGAGMRHGLLWLIQKGRLTPTRRTSGQRWSDDYSLVRTDGLRSCLNDNDGGGGTADQPHDEKRVAAMQRLDRARYHIGCATGSRRLADLLDAVCGRGETLRSLARGDKDQAERLEVELMIALDMAAVSYDIVRVAA